mgnify:CR=1 FL=1
MVIRLHPLFAPKLWGGNRIRAIYGDHVSSKIGECWGLSAHKSASNLVANGPYAGTTLRELYQKERPLFGNYPAPEFPILMKLIDAADDLSIQVHPNEAYAQKSEHQHGKDECWYVLDAAGDASIIIGHNASSSEEFLRFVENGDYEGLMQRHPVKPGDYFYIPAGTVHAICKDTLLFEVSQSSDLTYRLYDYDRLNDGRPRELHLEKALAVIDYQNKELIRTHQARFFKFQLMDHNGQRDVTADRYGDYLHILSGSGTIDGETLKAGDFLMVPALEKYALQGSFKYALVNLM